MNQVHIFISGKVQGVGFRNFVKHEAKRLGLIGWVRNLSDKRVETVAQGSEEKLNKFISICSRGHFLSEVAEAKVSWEEPAEAFEIFEKKPTV